MQFPTPCEIHAHQHFEQGECHGLGITPAGRPFALVVIGEQSVMVQYLDEHYSVKLVGEQASPWLYGGRERWENRTFN